jgi:hypothetical protein
MRFVSLLSLIFCVTGKPGPHENFLKQPLKINMMKVVEPLLRTDHQLSKSSRMFRILCVYLSEPSIDITYPGRTMMVNSIKVCLLGVVLTIKDTANMLSTQKAKSCQNACINGYFLPTAKLAIFRRCKSLSDRMMSFSSRTSLGSYQVEIHVARQGERDLRLGWLKLREI